MGTRSNHKASRQAGPCAIRKTSSHHLCRPKRLPCPLELACTSCSCARGDIAPPLVQAPPCPRASATASTVPKHGRQERARGGALRAVRAVLDLLLQSNTIYDRIRYRKTILSVVRFRHSFRQTRRSVLYQHKKHRSARGWRVKTCLICGVVTRQDFKTNNYQVPGSQ